MNRQVLFRLIISNQFFSFYLVTNITGAQPENFQGSGGVVELGNFDKHFVKNTRKKGPADNSFGVFSPRFS